MRIIRCDQKVPRLSYGGYPNVILWYGGSLQPQITLYGSESTCGNGIDSDNFNMPQKFTYLSEMLVGVGGIECTIIQLTQGNAR